jgi:hypothetical protein
MATKTTKTAKTVKANVELQYGDKSVSYDKIVENAKAFLAGEAGIKDVKSLDLYVKPEEGRVYYVANGTETGSFEL